MIYICITTNDNYLLIIALSIIEVILLQFDAYGLTSTFFFVSNVCTCRNTSFLLRVQCIFVHFWCLDPQRNLKDGIPQKFQIECKGVLENNFFKDIKGETEKRN